MMNRRTAIQSATVFLPLAMGGSASAQTAGDFVRATDYPDLASAFAAAKLHPSRRLYIPAGDYPITPLVLDVDGLTIYGDGIGRTRLLCDGLVANTTVQLFRLWNARISLADFSIIITNASGTGKIQGIAVDSTATHTNLSRIEVVGGYGASTAGGSAFDFYRPAALDQGRQHAVVEDCIARDAGPACGFIVNSNANTFLRCQALRIGQATTQHGFYEQGGANTFDGCRADQCAGYSFHGHKQTGQDGSASVYRGCTSIDPGSQHMIVNSMGTPPFTRSVVVDSCHFKRSAGGPACRGVGISVPGIVTNCVFEDSVGAADTWLSMPAGGVASNNLFRILNGASGTGIRGNGIVSGNAFVNWSQGTAVIADAGARVLGNTLELNGSAAGIVPAGNDVEISGNRITGASNGAGINNYIAAYTGFSARHNTIRLPSGKAVWMQTQPSGAIADNQLSSLVLAGAANIGLRLADNVVG